MSDSYEAKQRRLQELWDMNPLSDAEVAVDESSDEEDIVEEREGDNESEQDISENEHEAKVSVLVKMDFSLPKRARKSHLGVNEKEIVLNVYNHLSQTSFVKKVEECATITGVSRATIYRILKEYQDNECCSSVKPRTGRPTVGLDEDMNAVSKVDSLTWQNCIKHVISIEKKMWDMDDIIGQIVDVQPLIITSEGDDSEDELCSSDEDSDN
ncbi:hypothetical protein QE152_g16987 [Popillia japonica]|uniref:Helix-turn-helix domain-containing protein n=1 Tax=Popillia japonica TaxID=7064 RepID=A0AAW1L5P2_POPJA